MKWILTVALLLGGPAVAGEHDEQFHALDVDGDGLVSLAEATGNEEIVTRFDRADRDHDGKLSLKEFDLLHSDKLPRKVARFSHKRSAASGGTAQKKKTHAKAAAN